MKSLASICLTSLVQPFFHSRISKKGLSPGQRILSFMNVLSICTSLLTVSAGVFAQDQANDIAAPASGPAVIILDAGYRPPVHTENASLLYDNGPLINNPGGGVGGADESVLQSQSLGMSILGFGHQLAQNNHVADDFTIPADSWTVDSIVFWAYQTNSGNASTINDVRYRIWDGSPDDPGSTVLFGDLTTNRLIATTWDNLYRVSETTSMTTARPIMRNTASGGFTLPQGNYWIEWTTGGSLGSGPWAPPITINGMTTTGNALQWLATSWAPVTDVGQQGFPFQLYGTPPSTDPLATYGVHYGSTGSAEPTHPGALITIDPLTGGGTLIGATGIVDDNGASVPAIAIRSTGEIYALSSSANAGLYTVNASTGVGAFVGITGLSTPNAMTFDGYDQLYIADGSGTLYTMDETTGIATAIGPLGFNVRGIAFDPTDGTMYGSSGTDGIYTIDPTTATATFLGNTGLGGSTPDIHFDLDGNLFGTKIGAGTIYNYVSINKQTGAGTLIGSTGFTAVIGLSARQVRSDVVPVTMEIGIDPEDQTVPPGGAPFR